MRRAMKATRWSMSWSTGPADPMSWIGIVCALALPGAALAESPGEKNDKNLSIVAMPIPMSNPALGNGLGVAALAIYTPGSSPQPWISGVGGLYTDTKSWAAAVFQKAHLADDKLRITAGAGGGDFKLDFYGIGANAGARNRSIPIDQQSIGGLAEALYRVAPRTYAGVRYRGAKLKTSIDLTQLPFPDLELPQLELDSQTSALGLAFEFDSRDNEFAPRKGVYATGQALRAAKEIGSDFDYTRLQVAVNGYKSLSPKSAIAGRVSLCDVGHGAPFYDLCMFGQNNDLRGYTAGQYRDHFMAAAQVEYRRDLFWRLGAVAFVGVGGVSPSIEKFGSALLPAAGVGLRLRASKAYGVNASLDFAVGDDSQAFYFYIGEAF